MRFKTRDKTAAKRAWPRPLVGFSVGSPVGSLVGLVARLSVGLSFGLSFGLAMSCGVSNASGQSYSEFVDQSLGQGWRTGGATGSQSSSSYSPSYRGRSVWDGLEPVDPGASDVGHLGLQTRLVPMSLRDDRDFGILYRAVTADGEPVFARRDGGITALFPRSAYVDTPDGAIPLIPPDTRFIIGEPTAAFAQGLGLGSRAAGRIADPSGGLRLDGRISDRAVDARFAHRRRSGSDEVAGQSASTPRRGMRALLSAAVANERRGHRADG